MRTLKVQALWDGEAGVWVAESDDVPGLATEAATLEELLLKTCTSRIPRINFHPLLPAAPDPGRGAPAG
ncbi:DUF1902 domain-containing protein [Thermus thermophilus]|uniref:DUF1902 domain-containing protein n=1 Tax=Thermus thermophilus TaxID=274 RepID=UPI0030B9FC18